MSKTNDSHQGPSSPTDPHPSGLTHPGEDGADLARLLENYLADLDAGRSPDPATLLAAYPHLAPQLAQAIAGLEFVHRTTRPSPDTPAQLGDFRLIREVGRGGMGVVYEAEQISLRRRVALKVLRFGAVADEIAMQRFQREAETVARLHHTNIVPIFAVGSAEGVRYYAMQFIEGRDLAERLRQARDTHAVIPERDLADWGLQAAEALAHAHRRGVIHRDIKPSNLICDPDGRVWLTDFGLARRTDDAALSLTGALLGTPRYMSPEQARAAKEPVDHRTDLYSLGATLYELATLHPIFEAATAHEVIAQILHADPPSPRSLAPHLARDLETIILKCLAKEPADRYATAQALAEDLRAFLDGRPIAARPPSLPERVARWTRKHRRTTTVAAISAATVIALLAGGTLAWQSHHNARLGRLALSPAGPNVVAEVLDSSGRLVTPAFPVPTTAPLSLPAGPYHIRLSAAGMLSESWPVDLEPRQIHHHSLSLQPRWLWPPQEVRQAEIPETQLIPRGTATDLLVLTHASLTNGVPHYESSLALLRGHNYTPAWPHPLRFNESTLPANGPLEEWKRLLSSTIAPSFLRTGIEQRSYDLNDDQAPDLVLLSRHSPSLLAISGANGAVLWWSRFQPDPASSQNQPPTTSRRGFVVGCPTVAHVDSDRTPDFIACFWAENTPDPNQTLNPARASAQGWIAAVSGRTGDLLWQQPLPHRWEQYPYSSSDRDRFDALVQPATGTLHGQPIVALLHDSQLLGWNVHHGAPAWTPIELGFAPPAAPDLSDLDGDGHSEALLLRPLPEKHLVDLIALTLPQGAPRWTQPARTFPTPYFLTHPHPPRAALPPSDLDGDGRPEIVALAHRPRPSQDYLLGLQLLQGHTGQPRWTAFLGLGRSFGVPETIEQVLLGPDLDGDAHREIFVVWPSEGLPPVQRGLRVAALSGRTGQTLWRTLLPGASDSRTLAWWIPGADGWPLLLVGVQHAGGGQRMTYALASSSGQIAHTLPDVADPQAADLNGDGLLDLFYTVSPQGAPRHLAIQGAPATPWRRPGTWRAAADLDRDGHLDLLGADGSPLSARSGQDGHLLWRSPPTLQFQEPWLAPQLPQHDLNSDGFPDLALPISAWRRTGDGANTTYQALAAYSGKDFQPLWLSEAGHLGNSSESGGRIGWSFAYPTLDWHPQPKNTPPNLLVAHRLPNEQLRLTCLHGPSGHPLWSLPIIRGGFAPFPSPSGPPLADANQDHVPDLALWSPQPNASDGRSPCRLALFDGSSGQPLWTSQDVAVEDETRIPWPEVTLGNLDGDAWPEAIVTRHHGYEAQSPGYRAEVIAADGRTGQIRWSWSWSTGFPDLWPPLVLPRGPQLANVCLAVREPGFDGLVLLNPQGQVQNRLPLTLPRNSLDAGRLVWRALDPDLDGHADLLLLDGDHLCLARGDNLEIRWRWPVPGPLPMALDPIPASPNTPPILPVWVGRDILGLDALDGTPRWRGRLHSEPNLGGPLPRVIPTPQFNGLPRIQLVHRAGSSGPDANVLGQTWPTDPTGHYLAPKPPPLTFAPLPEFQAPQRPWPWAEPWPLALAGYSGAASLVLLALPAGLAWWAFRRRSWALGLLPVCYSGLGILLFDQGAAVLVALAYSGWLLAWSWRSRAAWLAAVAVLYVTLSLLPFLSLSADHPLRQLHPWGPWWWLNECVGEPLLFALASSPPLLFWTRIIAALRQRAWRKLGGWAAVALSATLILGAAALLLDRPRLLPSESYASEGWYGIAFVGIYATACLQLLHLAWLSLRQVVTRDWASGKR